MKATFPALYCFKGMCPEQTARVAHVHDIHEFFICTNGHGTQFAGHVGIPQHRADVVCFPAGMPHYGSGTPHALAKGWVIMVSPFMFSPEVYGDRETYLVLQRVVCLARQGRNPLPLQRETAHCILSLARDMVQESDRKRPGYQSATRLLLQDMFLHMMRDPAMGVEVSPRDRTTYHEEQMARVLRFIDGHFMETITVDHIVKIAGMSRSHFHAVFRAVAGCTLIDYVTRVRIRAAQRLLRESDAPIIQVAMDCGFATLSRFYAACKSITHKTPRELRVE